MTLNDQDGHDRFVPRDFVPRSKIRKPHFFRKKNNLLKLNKMSFIGNPWTDAKDFRYSCVTHSASFRYPLSSKNEISEIQKIYVFVESSHFRIISNRLQNCSNVIYPSFISTRKSGANNSRNVSKFSHRRDLSSTRIPGSSMVQRDLSGCKLRNYVNFLNVKNHPLKCQKPKIIEFF